MRQKGWCVVAVGLLLAAAPGDAAKEELDKLQGEWVLASGERDGKETPAEEAEKLTRIVKGDQYTLLRDGKVVARGTLQVDPTKKPRTIDVKRTEEGAHRMLGIYELDGDTQKVCFSAPGKDRPTEFSAKAGSGNLLSVWKRKK
jgi:uncharacterized protein (TIGR03067 family)